MKTVSIKRNNKLTWMFLVFFCTTSAQKNTKIKIWSKTLKDSIIMSQFIKNDSIILYIYKNENEWLGKNAQLKTINYWSDAPIKVSSEFNKKNNLIIKRTFLGNSIVGDKLYFKKYRNKYYYYNLKEFEQKP